MIDGIRIELKGDELQGLLQIAAARGRNLREPLLDAGEYLLRETKERIKRQRGPEGEVWPALSERTIRKKGHDKALQETGRLQNSLTYKATRAALELGTTVEYAAIHQFGGEVKEPERTGVLHLLSDEGGGLVRRGEWSKRKPGPLSKFAARGAVIVSERSKAFKVARSFTIGAYSYEMPARPYLGVNAMDRAEFVEILRSWILGRLASGS